LTLSPYVMKTHLISTLLFLPIFTQAAVLFEESFEYGGSLDDIRNVSTWDTTSGVIDYDPTGLDAPGMNGEAGGSILHNFSGGSRSANLSISVDPFPTASAGDEFWFAGLIQLNSLTFNNSTGFSFSNGQSVNNMGFFINSSGDVILNASDNGGAASSIDTGEDITATGTYLFLSRATIGAGPDSDKQSTVDFWFNPTDTSSVAALGAATFSTGADSKIGRSTGAYSSVSVNFGSENERVDEIRFGESLVDVVGVPEPGTFALVGIAFGTLLLIRRQR